MTTAFGLKYLLGRDRRPFTREEVQRVEADRAGVYALWLPLEDWYECIYVGKSERCVRRRLLDHLSRETNPDLRRLLRVFRDMAMFSAAYTESAEETDALETEVIQAWQPETNRVKL